MKIYVARAVALPPTGMKPEIPNDVREQALPPGFPFLMDADEGTLIEPVLLYLSDKHLRAGRRWVKNSAVSEAYALADYWRYLEARGLAWCDASWLDVEGYRDAQQALLSPRTHEGLRTATIRLRLTHVVSFYAWARRVGLCDLDLGVRTVRSEGGNATVPVPKGRRPGSKVRVISPEQMEGILLALGTSPFEKGQADLRASRDWLAAQLALATGMRVDEVAQLCDWQILQLPEATEPVDRTSRDRASPVYLRITQTKGLVERTVVLPRLLLQELVLYIQTERATAVFRDARPARQKARTLFVNGLDAGPNAGRAITARTLQRAFHRAVVDRGLLEQVPKVNPENGESYLGSEAKYSFHDLRHTFAHVLYAERKRGGDPEPWKLIQARLGHKHLSTTVDTYLQIFETEEGAISDALWNFHHTLTSGRR